MESFVAVLHIVVALVLIGLVLVQDTKSGSVGVFGGGGSNSVLGATGATTLAQKLTRWSAAVFAVTCIMLTVFSNRGHRSVLDSLPATSAVPAATGAPAAVPGAEAPTGPAATTPAAESTGTAPATTGAPTPTTPAPTGP